MTKFIIETLVLALIFICINYALNKNTKTSFLLILVGNILAAMIAIALRNYLFTLV
jgi:hypothetical protein